MVFHTVPKPIQKLFPRRIWEGEKEGNQVYLTFDDGPVPGVTDFVLAELAKRGQKASFFVVGDNVRKHPTLAREVKEAGHQIGNHTYHHLHGFRTAEAAYMENFWKAENQIQEVLEISTRHFRPPYGMLKNGQAKEILKTHQIVMWNILSGDYAQGISPQRILSKIQQTTKPGSILLFHDQQKTQTILPKFLPDFLDFLQDQGLQTSLL